MHSFVGLLSYFRRFLPNFSILAKPLYDLLKKLTPFVFGQEQLKSFNQLKDRLISVPVLSIYLPDAETQLQWNGSPQGFGSCLFQKQDDGKFHPVSYFSKRTTEAESRYHSYELECLCIIYSLNQFHVYLYGITFKVVTDCNSLKLTLDKRDINPRKKVLFNIHYSH